jgi:SAM-dependent methyltransferase
MTPDLDQTSALTLDYYNQRAEQFWAGTRDHDVSQNIAALLNAITAPPPFTILDFGCGPGRDLKALAEKGHRAIGLDGAESFAAMARAHSGCEVLRQDFLSLDLPPEHFDGIFANASLFHIPSRHIQRVLEQLCACLKPGGVLFASNPHGRDQEGWNDGRYGTYHSPESWRKLGTEVGFSELSHYYRPAGRPRILQPWLATVWRKI